MAVSQFLECQRHGQVITYRTANNKKCALITLTFSETTLRAKARTKLENSIFRGAFKTMGTFNLLSNMLANMQSTTLDRWAIGKSMVHGLFLITKWLMDSKLRRHTKNLVTLRAKANLNHLCNKNLRFNQWLCHNQCQCLSLFSSNSNHLCKQCHKFSRWACLSLCLSLNQLRHLKK